MLIKYLLTIALSIQNTTEWFQDAESYGLHRTVVKTDFGDS